MTLHHFTPFATDKDLGRAYNKAMSMIGEDDWACIRDIDTMFLLPEQPAMIEQYIELFPSAGLLCCYTNRIHHLSPQLYFEEANENTDILWHIEQAERMKANGYNVTEIKQHLSGFLMVISKKTWNELPFVEGIGCLGVDTNYWGRLVRAGKKILRMDSVYIWHTYRLDRGIHNKKHLE